MPAVCRVIAEIPQSAHGKYARDQLRHMHTQEAHPAAPGPQQALPDSAAKDATRQVEPRQAAGNRR